MVVIHHRVGMTLAVVPVMMAFRVAVISRAMTAPLVMPMVPVTGNIVVLRPVYMAAGAVLHFVQAFALVPVQVTVGCHTVVGAVEAALLLVEAPVFVSGDLTLTNPVTDALHLSVFPPVDHAPSLHASRLSLYPLLSSLARPIAGPRRRCPYPCQD